MNFCASPKFLEKLRINNKKLFGHIYCDIPIYVETKSEGGYITDVWYFYICMSLDVDYVMCQDLENNKWNLSQYFI